jgi:phage tail tape-measure protein
LASTAGSFIGSAIGSCIAPGIGTAIGGLIGSLIGGWFCWFYKQINHFQDIYIKYWNKFIIII